MSALAPHIAALLGDGLTLLFTGLRVAAVYLALLLFLYWSGPRTLNQTTLYGLVTLLLISNVVQNAMIGPDISLAGGLLGAGILLLINQFVARSNWTRKRLEHEPVILVYKGKVVNKSLQREDVSLADLQEAARGHGVASLSEVETAVLEMDGGISIISKAQVDPKRLQEIERS